VSVPAPVWQLYEALEAMADAAPGRERGYWLDLARHAVGRRLQSPRPARRGLRAQVAPFAGVARELRRSVSPKLPTAPHGRVVFVVDAPSHWDHARPMMEELREPALVLSLTLNAPWLTHVQRERQLRLEPFGSRRSRLRASGAALAWSAESPALVRHIARSAGAIAREHQRPWACPSIADALREELAFSHLFQRRAEMQALVKAVRPSALVSFNEDGGARRLLVRVARDLGVPTLHVQHGLIGRHPKFRRPLSERWCVWGSANVELLEALGHPAGTLTVTGPVGFEGHRPTPWNPDPAGCRVLVTALSGASETPRAVVEAALEATLRGLSAVSGVHILLKPHPDDLTSLAAGIASRFERVELLSEPSMLPALSRADVVVTLASTTLLDDDPAASIVPYVREGAALGASTADELAARISQISSDAALREALRARQREYAERYAWRADAGSAARVAAVIAELTAARGPR
jgi:hypothetical protein